MTLGERIQCYRKSNNLSQEQLAELINVSRQAISKWESNQAMPDLVNIVALSKVFNVTTDDLLNNDLQETQIKVKPTNDFEYLISKIKRHWYKIGYLMIGYGGYHLLGFLLFYFIAWQMDNNFHKATENMGISFTIPNNYANSIMPIQMLNLIPMVIYILMILLGFLLLFVEHKKYGKKKMA